MDQCEAMGKNKIFLIWVIVLTLIFSTGQVKGDEINEDQVKVAFLYNFAKFVEWPADSFRSDSAPLVITILGTDPFGSLVDSLKEKTVRGRRIQIRRLGKLENLEDCHLLFISNSEKTTLRSLLGLVKNHAILTVSDMDRFAHQGGMIGLVNMDGKINFEINIDVVQRSRLKFSAQLLKLARIVHSGS
jgi:hypothetical protein